MAVYDQTYRGYDGELTGRLRRLMVLPAYAYRDLFGSRFFLAYFVSCFVAPLGGMLVIYLHHNVSALQILHLDAARDLISIDAAFFSALTWWQGMMAYLLALVLGPALVAPDLLHNALPLYLSRPFGRWDYVLGKFAVLAILASAVTWVPLGLALLLQVSLAGGGWLTANASIPAGVILGSMVWVAVISLLALAVSAWVRWKPVARGVMIGLFLVLGGMGEIVNGLFRTALGDLLDIGGLIAQVWAGLFGLELPSALPLGWAWVALAGWAAAALLVLSRKLRAYEVIR